MKDCIPQAVSLDIMPRYKSLYEASPVHASDTSFANIWGWTEYFGLEVYFCEHLAWVRQTRQTEQPVWWAAVGPWRGIDWTLPGPLDQGGEFCRVPEDLALTWKEALGDRVELTEARGQWEYLYRAQSLAELKGNKLHKKRNHVNAFFKSYPAVYEPITADCLEDVLEMQQEWYEWNEFKNSPSLVAENHAIRRVLECWDQISGLRGGALHLEGQIIAYTVGEVLGNDTLVVHFEKARPEFRGVYQAINQQFAEAEAGSVIWINREQDLDEPGLRQAKESYYPEDFIKKYAVKIRAKE